MPFGGHQMRVRRLWSVTSTVTRTNERVNDITGLNPKTINDFYSLAYFSIRVTGKLNLPLVGVRVYGSDDPNGFPAAGTVGEALVTTATDIGLNQGLVRAPAMHQVDGDVPGRPIVIPKLLLLEFSTGAPGATPTITFQVLASFLGPHLSSSE
jgi:hypothetical protein